MRKNVLFVLVLIASLSLLSGCDLLNQIFGVGPSGSVSITSHSTGDTVRYWTEFRGSYSGDVAKIEVTFGGDTQEANRTVENLTWDYSLDVSPIPDGNQDFTVAIYDAHGNEIAKDMISLTVDNVFELSYSPLFVPENTITMVGAAATGVPAGFDKAFIHLINLPAGLNGVEITVVGPLYAADGSDHSWDNAYGGFTTTVASGSADFQVYFDPTYDHTGWPAVSYTAADELSFAVVATGYWTRVVNSQDNAQDLNDTSATVFILDVDPDDAAGVNEAYDLTIDYSNAVP